MKPTSGSKGRTDICTEPWIPQGGPSISCLPAEDRLRLRQSESRPILDKLHDYLLAIETEVLPKSPEGRAVRYTLKNWTALNRYCDDGDLEIDNNHTERAIRGVAVGRNNWIFF